MGKLFIHSEERKIKSGGDNNYYNLGVSCSQCNRKKHDKTEEEYRNYITYG